MEKKHIKTINQTFGTNTTENTCFCQLKSAYNTIFGNKNLAICVGQPDMHCLIYSIKGTGVIEHKSKKNIKLSKNNIFFGSMKDMSVIKSSCSEWHFLCYWYIVENLDVTPDGLYTVNIDITKELEEVTNLIKLMNQGSYMKLSLANSLFTTKLINLLESLDIHAEAKSLSLINNIILYVNQHIKEKINIKSIANEFGYCEKHIRYLFKRHLNTTPSKYIDDLKLDQISLMLQTTSYSLEYFAETFNYSSASHLINNFKKRFKYTPKQYLLRIHELQEKSGIKEKHINHET